ncbi:dUTP diphosphatase [Parahaliea mediterranea]|uniref:dUTP diphosphatase n=1 Tax=Parahaliea mediterranea TaxID=651086 RepID=A0A939DGI3_9GAMM|nr:dUTP diphosphatase [Parahaliea mediterranea]MBN7797751.1 dUTP diphosphatase [Parahaliea mediterranea]
MQQALENMLAMQHSMNTRVHEQWIEQQFAWYRAIWIECGELVEHYGYKWWKKQEPDMAQVQLEVIDIWHFGMSALFAPGKPQRELAAEIAAEVSGFEPAGLDVREATEALAQHALETRSFSPARFWELMLAAGLDFETLYSAYVGKNVLNFFRQDHGYKEGTYAKTWQGREDNEHLVEVMDTLDGGAGDFADQVYAALEQRYREATGAA